MKPPSTRRSGLNWFFWTVPEFALLVWANWKPLPLSERYELPPVLFAAFDTRQTVSITDSLQLTQQLNQLPGVSAITINRPARLIGVACQNPGSLMLAKTQLQGLYAHAGVKDFSTFHGPVCPIPQRYVNVIYRVRKLFCFR